MFLPQLLNYLRFLRWRRSSSKTKACKFFKYSFSARSRCTSASKSSSIFAGIFLGLPLLPRPRRSTANPFRAFFQINPFPCNYAFVIVNFKMFRRFPVAPMLTDHCFYDLFLEFWCVSFIWYSFWHSKHPSC